MCGFGGIIGSQKISLNQIKNIAKQVKFRGPDYTGVRVYSSNFEESHEVGVVGLFHNRLSIIDLEDRSNQPYEDNENILLFNGEIYNYIQLKNELKALGFCFNTKSDTEVLFTALKHWGVAAIQKLNGMFAFAFVDKKRKSVLLVRDRLGIKPLYYQISEKTICFASEVDSIIRMVGRMPTVDYYAMVQCSILQYVPGNKSIWADIYKVEPGTYLEIKIGDGGNYKYSIKKYWDAYEVAKRNIGNTDLRSLITDVIGEQILADVPVGVSLSSGVDSSLLAALINIKYEKNAIKYYTVGFSDAFENDESINAKKFLDTLGVADSSFFKLALNGTDVRNLWVDLYKFVDEPFGDQAILLNWAISKEASKHVKVMLSGDGADEIFGGYERYRTWTQLNRFSNYTESIMRITTAIFNHKGMMMRSDPNLMVRYFLMLDPGVNSANEIRNIFAEFIESLQIDELLKREDLPRLIDIKSYLPGAMLFKVDRASMAEGLEVRVPFLDNRIVETGLSSLSFSHNKPLKWRLKNILTELAPHYDLTAPKKGLSLPLFRWMREQWRSLIYEIFQEADFESLGFDKKKSISILNSFFAGNDAVGYHLWMQANIMLWYKIKVSSFKSDFSFKYQD
jgi:asparagine synthase (glutamine-hydrolysing)